MAEDCPIPPVWEGETPEPPEIPAELPDPTDPITPGSGGITAINGDSTALQDIGIGFGTDASISTLPATWSSFQQYRKGWIVTSGGATYRAIADSLNDIPPSANWTLITGHGINVLRIADPYVYNTSPGFVSAAGPYFHFDTGTSGLDINWTLGSPDLDSVVLNVPDASVAARGAITNLAQTIAGTKTTIDTGTAQGNAWRSEAFLGFGSIQMRAVFATGPYYYGILETTSAVAGNAANLALLPDGTGTVVRGLALTYVAGSSPTVHAAYQIYSNNGTTTELGVGVYGTILGVATVKGGLVTAIGADGASGVDGLGNSFMAGILYAFGSGSATGTNTGDQLVFKTISVAGQSDVVADSTTDTLTLVEGTGITITTNAGTDTITISASGGGSVSSVTAADGTLTISPTTGTVVAGINLANNDDWTGQHTFTTPPKVKAGTGSMWAFVGGSLYYYYGEAGSGASETDLYTDPIVANTLHSNGDQLTFEYAGQFEASATATRRLRVYFGGTAIFDTGALTSSSLANWVIKGTIIRIDGSTIGYAISMTVMNVALAAYTAVGNLGSLTLSVDNTLKVTGESGGVGAATNDIIAAVGNIFWWPASTGGGSGGGSSSS